VADGVGSWGSDGVDASRYSKELMEAAQEYLDSSSGEEYNVKDLIEHAHDRAHSPGSATICVAKVDPDGLLEVANIGDCGLRVVRGSKCVFATEASGSSVLLGSKRVFCRQWPTNSTCRIK